MRTKIRTSQSAVRIERSSTGGPHLRLPCDSSPPPARNPRRLARNFAALSAAEVLCRAISVAVTLSLAKRLGTAGYGQIEFAFNLVFWLVLLVREGFDVIAAREIARHPRLVRKVVEHVLAIRLIVATFLLAALALGTRLLLPGREEQAVMGLYGLMLLTTALGIDFVYRGLERMGIVALSMFVRTLVYAACVWLYVTDSADMLWVPALLVSGEICGIALVWGVFTRQFGLPRPRLRQGRALRVFLSRGRTIYLIQVSQALVISVDVVIVGLMSGWNGVGLYSASHRMVVAVLTFGLIFQQVAFPSLARSWRSSPEAGRLALDGLVRVLLMGFLPIAVGTSVLAVPLVARLFGPEYAEASTLLALEIWRAPLLSLAFLYQTTLIALNRESLGVRYLLGGALGSIPLTALMRWQFGLPGAAAATVVVGICLVFLGYSRLCREGRQPSWHHQLGKPLLAAAVMAPVSGYLAQYHLWLGILAGALTYLAALMATGGLRKADLALLHRPR